MGRGRAKAKQTKVARELKYHSPDTDLAALQRELGGTTLSDERSDDAESDDSDDESDEDDEDEDSDEVARWVQRRS
jgi:hypothetical protein